MVGVVESAGVKTASLLVLLALQGCRSMPTPMPALVAPLEANFVKWEAQGPTGEAPHREQLQALATAIGTEIASKGATSVLFVCTHNSRRSHMAQLIAAAAAQRAGVSVTTYSGGTEATAFNPRAIAALQRAGFQIQVPDGKNPHAQVSWSQRAPVEAFSKTLDAPENPSKDFIAVMVCSQADGACPIVKGSVRRIAIPYEDPKVADGTPEEAARYDERVEQFGRDLAWVFRQVAAAR